MISTQLWALNPSDFEFKRHIITPKKQLNKVILDAHVITRLNPGYSNLLVISDNREVIPFRVIPLKEFDHSVLKLIDPLPGTLENPNATSFYIESPKAPLYGLEIEINGTLPIEHKVTVSGFMLNPNEKRPVGQNFSKKALTDGEFKSPLFRPITYPYYEIMITPKVDLSLKQVKGLFKQHALFFRSSDAGAVTLYYGSHNVYPIQKIHDPSIQVTSEKAVELIPEGIMTNPSFDDPNKLKSAWKNPRIYFLLFVIVALTLVLKYIRKRNQ